MKKFITIILSVLTLATGLFAEFPHRVFEIDLGLDASASNNGLRLDDVLKENAVIDFTALAKRMPKEGCYILATADASAGLGLNIKSVHAGLNAGVEGYFKFGVSKDLFNFLGKGNADFEKDKVSEELLNAKLYADGESFIYTNIESGFEIKGLRFEVVPSVFVPLYHLCAEDSGVTITNTEDGNINLLLNGKAKLYSALDYNNIEISSFTSSIGKNLGFDLACSCIYPLREDLDLKGTIRTPIVPGHLRSVSEITTSWSLDSKVTDVMKDGGNFGSPETKNGEFISTDYLIHRPFKMNVSANYTPFGKFLVFDGLLGFGVKNPFSKGEAKFYPEYSFGALITAKDIVSAKISTEYTEQVFKHSFVTAFNCRVFELDTGVSFASPSFVSSFCGAGASVFIKTYFGF